MPNKNYQKGYRFQQRVKKYLESKGYFVILSPKSRFPDGIAVNGFRTFFFECKWRKYLNREEKAKVEEMLEKYKLRFKVYWNNKRKIDSYWIGN